VPKKGIGSISSSRSEVSRIVDHHPEERTGKRLDQGFLVDRHSVSSILDIAVSYHVSDALVGMFVQQFPDWRA